MVRSDRRDPSALIQHFIDDLPDAAYAMLAADDENVAIIVNRRWLGEPERLTAAVNNLLAEHYATVHARSA